MKILVVYSSLTGNTEKIAQAIFSGLPAGSTCRPVAEAPAPDGFDLVVAGFWVDKGQADELMRAYLSKTKNMKLAFFFTLGDYPDGDHAAQVAAATKKMLEKNGNEVLGFFPCQGKVDPVFLERMKKMLPPDHPHALMSPARKARLDEAAKHPNETDLLNARNFIEGLLKNI